MSSDEHSLPIEVTLPDDIEATRKIYHTDPMVKTIIDYYADDHDLERDEAIASAAGTTVGATAAQLGLLGSDPINESEAIEFTIEGTYDDVS